MKSINLDKFEMKRIELSKHLEKQPNDLATKEQIQFIDDLLKNGDNGEWAVIWKEWEKNNLYWPNINKNGH